MRFAAASSSLLSAPEEWRCPSHQRLFKAHVRIRGVGCYSFFVLFCGSIKGTDFPRGITSRSAARLTKPTAIFKILLLQTLLKWGPHRHHASTPRAPHRHLTDTSQSPPHLPHTIRREQLPHLPPHPPPLLPSPPPPPSPLPRPPHRPPPWGEGMRDYYTYPMFNNQKDTISLNLFYISKHWVGIGFLTQTQLQRLQNHEGGGRGRGWDLPNGV